MIEIQQAVAAAEAFVRKLFPEEISDLRLEEVERSDDGRIWFITLGWVDLTKVPVADRLTSSLRQLLAPDGPRTYKTLSVDAESGEVTSMKIRIPA